MSWSNVKLILAREIRDQLRDRRTLFMIAVLPLLLYPLLGMSFFQIAQFMREHPTKVLVVGASELRQLSDLPPLIENNRFALALFPSEDRMNLLELYFSGETGGGEETKSRLTQDEAQELLRQGGYQVVLYFPPDFAEQLDGFRKRLLSRNGDGGGGRDLAIPSPMIYYNTASEKSKIAYDRVSGVLFRWTEEIGRQNLIDSKIPILATKPFDFKYTDVAGKGHRDAAVWAKVLPFVLLIWALTGAFYPAIDLCAGEKERGTLETLLSSPAERSEIVWGKLMTVMIFSVATALLNLLSMGLTGSLVIAQLNRLDVPGMETLSLPPLTSLAWLVLALLPVAALFSALCLALAAFARSTKEGQYYLMPLVLVTMPLMILPMAPAVELNLGNSLIPVTGVVLLLRSVLEGNYYQALPFVPPVVAVTLACCLLAIRWAVDQFNTESVLFRESERLDLGLWLKHLVRDRGPTPSIAAALFCCVLILIIQFLMRVSLVDPKSFGQFAEMVFISQVVVIALPALMMTIFLTRNPRQTLLLKNVPSSLAIPAAVLLAIVLHPVIQALGTVVQTLYPMSDELIRYGQKFQAFLVSSPHPWIALVLVAVLPAVCEELAFRGFILSGLRHIGHKWWAIGISALFFGIVHPVMQQSIMAVMVGLVLGYLAVQTGSLLPCMLFHMTHNGLTLVSARLSIAPEVYERHPALSLLVDRVVENGQVGYVYGWPLIAMGAAVAGYLLAWFHRLPYSQTQEEKLQDALDRQSTWEMG